MIVIFILFLCLLQPGLTHENILPVLMIDQDRAMSHMGLNPNPFDKISMPQFADIIHDSTKHCESILIFMEESFSSEDLSLKDKKGSPYLYLRQNIIDKKAKYFPAVVEPHKLLMHVFPQNQYNVFHVQSRTKVKSLPSSKYIYIYFQDGHNETRMDALRRHDIIIRDICLLIRKVRTRPIIAFYTGKSNPVAERKAHFVPIKAIPVTKDLGVMVVSSGALFRFSGVYAATPTRRAIFNRLPTIADESWTQNRMSTRMTYTDFELNFNFSFLEDKWILDSVSLLEAGEQVGHTLMSVGAPWNMSYVCGEPLVILNTRDGSFVSISQYQIQPRQQAYRVGDRVALSTKATRDFGKSTNCGPYFNVHIISALFVTFICLTILLAGLVFIMNINTNSRYEDASSKPLVHPES